MTAATATAFHRLLTRAAPPGAATRGSGLLLGGDTTPALQRLEVES